ncbi:MAG TPA: hypothetical protein VJ901_20160 [Thermoanaerobaculia bacterium]|nr:hypothetical protein [Thermoanaerobaculia bacterium]
MRRILVLCVLALSAFGQSSPQWRTASDVGEGARGSIVGSIVDIEEGASRFQLSPDNDIHMRVPVIADTVSTQYNGFGGVINGQPEIFVGTKGFSNLRLGDRVEVRGIGRGNHAIGAEFVTLLGRSVPAGPTGVGDTRPPNTISTPTTAPSASDVTVYGRVEGVVRQVNADEGRVVVETDRREMMTIRATRNTPVFYGGQTYQISNLEIGDRVRIEPQSTSTTGGEVTARSMEVVRSIQEGGTTRSVTQVEGRITRIDRATEMVRVDTGRGEVRVDLTNAYDASGARIRARDVQAGDRVTITGSFGSTPDLLSATTVRFVDANDNSLPGPTPGPVVAPPAVLAVATIWGTVSDTLTNGPTLIVTESKTGAQFHIYVTDDFVVRQKAGTHTTADKLKKGDAVVVKAYRDADGDYIGQTIRMR